MKCPCCNNKIKLMQECAYGEPNMVMGDPYYKCPKCGEISDYYKELPNDQKT